MPGPVAPAQLMGRRIPPVMRVFAAPGMTVMGLTGDLLLRLLWSRLLCRRAASMQSLGVEQTGPSRSTLRRWRSLSAKMWNLP